MEKSREKKATVNQLGVIARWLAVEFILWPR
jgi:hypothetical protein